MAATTGGCRPSRPCSTHHPIAFTRQRRGSRRDVRRSAKRPRRTGRTRYRGRPTPSSPACIAPRSDGTVSSGGIPRHSRSTCRSPSASRSSRSWPPTSVACERTRVCGPTRHGRRFGTLLHAVLAAVNLDAEHTGVADAAALQGRLLGATAEEIAAAAEAAGRALAHPLMRRAAAAARAGRCRRETPVLLRLDDGVLVEGVVDTAFLEDGAGWTIVDFKTDVEIAGRLEEYRRQVGLYARAIAQATGAPARGVLLRV